ncbi:MAG: SusC/RagA family TonB-linked outer membrane protein [Odoribacteraceae bacterium]|nr:SusC/RagA family TonB-linked outer membrane protein [Odoribacteraceae bacterium]
MMMRISCFLFLAGALQVHGGAYAQNDRVALDQRSMTLEQVFGAITRQLQYDFFYSDDELDLARKVSLPRGSMRVDELLRLALGEDMGFRFIDRTIVITPLPPQAREARVDTITGVVKRGGDPLAGANVRLKGAASVGVATDGAGRFRLFIPRAGRQVLVFSFIGMVTKEVPVTGSTSLVVSLEDDVAEVEEVVVMGMFNRRAESFTGAAVTFKQEDLKRVGNQNLLSSLKNLDPSFIIQENLEFGSDPNHMPEITMRGQTSIPVDIEGEYRGNINQPLFILDGFETTLTAVFDLDMNKVASVTLLKDASAKAIYGSKAGNGVVVIETILPKAGNLQISYNGSADIEAPDLTSYNLTNAAEKLQAEWMAGKYAKSDGGAQAAALGEYHALQKEVARGVNTYWLSQPLRVGVGQKHALGFTGGNSDMRYSVNVSFGDTKGTMIGSDRQTLAGNMMLSYLYESLSIRNNLTISVNKGKNSPYGSFATYANMNPYWRIRDENGVLIKQYATNVFNPLHNASLNVVDESSYTSITENIYVEWTLLKSLRLTGKLGVGKSFDDMNRFIPSDHTEFANVHPNSEVYADRGRNDVSNSKSTSLNTELGLAYSIRVNKHTLYSNAIWKINTNSSQSVGTSAVGFPSDKMSYISLGNRYNGEKPSGTESLSRSVDFVVAANYAFDNRYFTDFSYTGTASSRFGADSRWGHFWSVGAGWNLHNEAFIKQLGVVNNLRLRGSIGYTGSQEFDPYQAIASYQYYAGKSYDAALGSHILSLANNKLKWQQQLDRNVGFDISLFDRVSARGDFYSNITRDLLTDVTLTPSIGFPTYKENLGEKENTGYELSLQVKVLSDPGKRLFANVFGSIAHNSDKLVKISDALKTINQTQDARVALKPLVRFEEGKSTTGIWAVPSIGIDPVIGREVFVRQDGSLTTVWSAADQQVVGNSQATVTGNVGAYVGYKGLSLNLSFNFRAGGQTYNSTLVEKVENVDVSNNNVDKRVLYDRWNTPGVAAKFKSITDHTTTQPTSRFVEDLDEFVFSSCNLSYELGELEAFKRLDIDRMRLSFNMNDIGRLSTVKQERGTAYPFARTFSFAVSATF